MDTAAQIRDLESKKETFAALLKREEKHRHQADQTCRLCHLARAYGTVCWLCLTDEIAKLQWQIEEL